MGPEIAILGGLVAWMMARRGGAMTTPPVEPHQWQGSPDKPAIIMPLDGGAGTNVYPGGGAWWTEAGQPMLPGPDLTDEERMAAFEGDVAMDAQGIPPPAELQGTIYQAAQSATVLAQPTGHIPVDVMAAVQRLHADHPAIRRNVSLDPSWAPAYVQARLAARTAMLTRAKLRHVPGMA